MESVYSKRIRAGKRRTYFFDVRETRGNDYYLTITESRKRFDSEGYDRHKIFLYKEDFNKFIKGLAEAIDYVKTELMPDFDFDAFNHDTAYEGEDGQSARTENAGTENAGFEMTNPATTETTRTDLTDTPPAEETQLPEVKNNDPVDNGNSEAAEKW